MLQRCFLLTGKTLLFLDLLAQSAEIASEVLKTEFSELDSRQVYINSIHFSITQWDGAIHKILLEKALGFAVSPAFRHG